MIYLALLFIFIGIFFLFRAFMDKSIVIPPIFKKDSPPPNVFIKQEPLPQPQFLYTSPPPPPIPKQTPIFTEEFKLPTPQPISPPISKTINQNTPKVIQQKSSNKPRLPQLTIHGILYLDQEQSCRKLKGLENTPFNISFNGVQRVGNAKLWVENDVFKIFCGNASYVYLTQTLDQIIFHETGIALVPNLHYQAAAIFLSDEVDKLKNFIQANSVSPI